MKENVHISVVTPIYGCSTALMELYFRLKFALENITNDFEIIFVNDGSPDNAWQVIKDICSKDKRVKGVNLSRNFGQQNAITAGLNYVNGDWTIIMDCDLQDRPEEIINFYNKAISGYDIVLGRRINRSDNFAKRLFNLLFYKTFEFLTDVKIDRFVGTYRILSKEVVKNFRTLNEQSRFFGGLINWLGFDTEYIDIKHDHRKDGKSAYTFMRLLKMALNNILSFSDKLLRIVIKLGFLLILFSSVFIIYKIIENIIGSSTAIGWSSLIASIFFTTGLVISVMGIVGLYIGKIFEETKKRPLFIVKDILNP